MLFFMTKIMSQRNLKTRKTSHQRWGERGSERSDEPNHQPLGVSLSLLCLSVMLSVGQRFRDRSAVHDLPAVFDFTG